MRNYQVQNLKNIPLKTLLAIKENGYRSKDCTVDYCPFETEARIFELQTKKAELVTETAQEASAFDSQLLALMELTMPKKALLALLDWAFITELRIDALIPSQNAGQEATIECDLQFTNGKFNFFSGPKVQWMDGDFTLETCNDFDPSDIPANVMRSLKIEYVIELMKDLKSEGNWE